VVDVGTTVSEHTTGVEGPVGGINTDGEGSSGEGLGEGITVSGGDGNGTGALVGTRVGLTGLVSGVIGVRTLLYDTVVSDVVDGT